MKNVSFFLISDQEEFESRMKFLVSLVFTPETPPNIFLS